MTAFDAYRIYDDATAGRMVRCTLDDLDEGEVVIRSHFSSINYKDALAATGKGKVIRRYPCVGGIDVAGEVERSSDARFTEGDKVLVTGYGMGVSHDGGFSEFVRVPADWIVPLPQGLSLYNAMGLGTAGFTAALSIHRMEQNGLTPQSGRVVVTGATGGVASLAIGMLAQNGYEVVAITGKDSEHEYLKSLGARDVLSRHALQMGTRPLEKSQWAGAVDSVGGETLAWLTRTMQQNGVIASFGNAGGAQLNTTVMPFILRGVSLLGIDSAATPMALRLEIWKRLAGDLLPGILDEVVSCVPFEQLSEVFEPVIAGKSRGRTVIQFGSAL